LTVILFIKMLQVNIIQRKLWAYNTNDIKLNCQSYQSAS